MRAVNGYYENGRFMPSENINLPKCVPAILVFDDSDTATSHPESSWLNDFRIAVKQAEHEELPDFPRVEFNRKIIDLSDKEQ